MFSWTHKDITTNADAEAMRTLFHTTCHDAAAFDTETNGLQIMSCKPFLFQFGWVDIQGKQGWTFTVDIEQQPQLARLVILVWHMLVQKVPIYLAHNVKYDLHMLANIGLRYSGTNISDSGIWMRLGSNAVQEKEGGIPMKLKPFATRYISPKAAEMDSLLQRERTEIAAGYNLRLKQRLGWTKKKIDAFFGDVTNDVEDLPERERKIYEEWLSFDVPIYLRDKVHGTVDSDIIPYNVLNRKNVKYYGHLDIVWVLETYVLMRPIVEVRGNLDGVRREEANIYPLFDMERVGFTVNVPYLKECRTQVKQYIRERRADLCTLAGCTVSIGQHELIKRILYEQFNVTVDSTGSEVLDLIVSELEHAGNNADAVEFIKIVQELRTLEKWYSTYIIRFLHVLIGTDKIYTQVNQTGAVSGRVSCDFQQFPKDAIKRVDGTELFHPRKLIVVPEDIAGIVSIDYSQIELRLQAMYTILVGHPDLNLCRAYMPYECFCYTAQGYEHVFDFYDIDDIRHAYNVDWYYKELPTKVWTPLDVHGATTKAAFGIDETNPDFHALRYKGKRVNFAKNYGAQFGKIKTMFPEYDDEQIHRIDDAYYTAFPGVKHYHEYCYAIACRPDGIPNLFGIKYWNVSGHKLINLLPQGSGAYLLKQKQVEIYNYLKNTHAYSKMILPIHDEILFAWDKRDNPQIFFDIKHIMEDWSDALVPIVAEMELTTTNWAEKHEVHSIEDFNKEGQ